MDAGLTPTITHGEPPADVRSVLDVVARCLGDNIAGAYLFGSAVIGGLKPASDIDLLVLTYRPMSSATRRQLVAALLRVSGARAARGPARNAEVTVVARDHLVPWRHPLQSDFVFGEWLRDDFEAGAVPAPAVDPDLTLVLATALQGSRPLIGPALTQFLPNIPSDDIRRAIRDSLPTLVGGLAGDERNVMLTLARMWVTLATGAIVPKDAAADWLLPRLPERHRAVLAKARDGYLGLVSHQAWDEYRDEVHAFVVHANDAIERLSAGEPSGQ